MTLHEQSTQPIIMYHDRCFDGLCGAWVARRFFGDTVEYVALTDHATAPAIDVRGRDVYVIDFSFHLPIALALQASAKTFVVLDHHKSAEADVTALTHHVFDNKRSGAQIAWDYFFTDTTRPKLVDYIGDSDIWTHQLVHTREINAYIHSNRLDFDIFDQHHDALETSQGFTKIVEIGTVIRRVQDGRVASFAERSFPITFHGHTVRALNCPSDIRSDVGHLLASTYPPFAVLFYLDVVDGVPLWKVSLRGNGSVDVSEIAKTYGGGGHYSAAAFSVQDKEVLTRILGTLN